MQIRMPKWNIFAPAEIAKMSKNDSASAFSLTCYNLLTV